MVVFEKSFVFRKERVGIVGDEHKYKEEFVGVRDEGGEEVGREERRGE